MSYLIRASLFAVYLSFAFVGARFAHAAHISIGVSSDITSMDPHHLNLAPNMNIAEQVFSALLVNDENQRLRPGLAESWRAIDELTWEFKLRRGVEFHNGMELTAQDVKFSIERTRSVKGGQLAIFTRSIVNMRMLDNYTIHLTTANPEPNLPNDLRAVPIVNATAAAGATSADFDSGKAMVGAGPFRFVKFIRGDRVELARHERYWGEKPHWSSATFRILSNDVSRVAALLSREVDVIEAVPPVDIPTLRSQADIEIAVTPSNRMIHFHLDSSRDISPFVTTKTGKPLDKNPLKDVRVRQALSKAIDRDAIVKRTMEGSATSAGQFVPAGMYGYSPDLKPEQYDPAGARKLLADAGYPDGFGLMLHGPNDRYVNDEQVLQAVAQMISKVGIVVKVVAMPMAAHMARLQRGEVGVALLGLGVSSGEASYPLKALVATWDATRGYGHYNFGRYSNPKLDEMLNSALRTIDDRKRERMLQDATFLAIKDYGIIPLHFQVGAWAMRRPLKYSARMDERTYAHAVRPQ